MNETFDVTQTLSGKRILFAGATGFVGKVALAMLLERYGDVLAQLVVVVRKGSAKDASTRFFDKVARSEPFEPLRQRLGEDGAMAFLKAKCTVYDGDLTDPFLGLDDATVKSLKGQIDVVINCAGLVSFNPSLEVGLNVNTHGVKYLAEACLYWDVPVVHMSTAFVAGNRSGLVFEDEEIRGYFPKRGTIDGRDFSLAQELVDCESIFARLRGMAEDKALSSEFRQKALDRLEGDGRDVTDEKTMRLAIGRERKFWLNQRMVEAGMERAKHWGWPNTYTYTKSLGEQVLAETPGLRYAIVRPSIVESARSFPFPGWNEGFTTSAPIIYALLKGQNSIPGGEDVALDMIPVDMVCGSLIAITARQLVVSERRVYQQASSDSSPFYAARSVELVGLHKRRRFREREKGNAFLNNLRSRFEPRATSKPLFNTVSAPVIQKGARWLQQQIDERKPQWGAPRLGAMLERAKDSLSALEERTATVNMIVDLFLPFIWENRYIFRCDNTRSLYTHMAPHDVVKIPFDIADIDWRDYILNSHIPGLEKWVFPSLDEESEKRRVISAHRDLIELFEATVSAWRHRVAFRFHEGDEESRFSFGETKHFASRIGSFLLALNHKPHARVMLLSENRPEWAMAYFGILLAGQTSVPLDKDLTVPELVNIAKRSEASVCLVSDSCLSTRPELERAFREAGLATQIFSLGDAMVGDLSKPDGIGPVKKSASADDVASVIFTSGTTGTPKGVMLTHRNFCALVAKLAGSFDIGVGDGVLSVLPLHHTFEFSAGLLTPFSRGAEIAYIDELNADRIGDVLDTGRITGMVGVPALWQLFHRKLTQEMAARPKYIEEGLKALMSVNAELRNVRGINLGRLLFWPVHRKFGGKLKFMISGGSALQDDVHKAFHALGFDLNEGYGLTEAAPVLSVTKAGHKRLPGSVGKALPGIEIKILSPNAEGIGEVLARGPNVMAGYFADSDSTQAVLKDGWLHTGDLGRLDDAKQLYLCGRRKDVIIDANGKNVYPDELEELYAPHPLVKELSVVGLSDAQGGERVACLCVPEYGERVREEVRAELEAHFKKVSADLPLYRRIKVLRFWDIDLPKTSTRKVKRPLVVAELKRLELLNASAEQAKSASKEESGDWLLSLIAAVLQKPVSTVTASKRFQADLGFDSLMLAELSQALEQAGVPVAAIEDLTQIQTVADLQRVVESAGRKVSQESRAKEITKAISPAPKQDMELPIPEVVAEAGRSVLSAGQRVVYNALFDVKVTGKNFIPTNRNFLVVANHASHLDMGLVKAAFGEQGERMVALAARDYFFDTPAKRAYFENFTNLIPMDRTGSLRESLRLAGESLTQGFHLLIFPEGTRSENGQMLPFKPTTGYLALQYHVDVVPVYLHGTHDALPKGAWWPRFEKLEVRIGPPISTAPLAHALSNKSRSERYRIVTQVCENAVRALSQGRVLKPHEMTVPMTLSKPLPGETP